MLQKRFCVSFLLVVFLCSCWAVRVSRWDENSVASKEDIELAKQLEAAGDEHFKKRFEKTDLLEALSKWKESASFAPNARIYAKLSRGHYFLADAFYGLEDNEAARDKTFTEGLGYAEKSLQFSAPEMIKKIKDGSKWNESVAVAQAEAVPGLYWYAVNLGKWAASKGFVTKLRYKDDIKSTMDRVMALNPDFFYAAPYRYFGAYEAATSGLAGGDLGKSKENFKVASERAPDYLATKVLWAEYWAIKTQNRASFENLLNEVLKSDATKNPMIEPENRKEQEKAKKLLAQIEEHF